MLTVPELEWDYPIDECAALADNRCAALLARQLPQVGYQLRLSHAPPFSNHGTSGHELRILANAGREVAGDFRSTLLLIDGIAPERVG